MRGNEAITINEDTGELSWLTTSDNIGSNRITIRATDPFGLFVEQTFDVEVVQSLQNRPPVFTTDPVTTATASSGFEVTTLATGEVPIGVSVVDGFTGPRIVTANDGDQAIGIYAGNNDDRFDDASSVSTGFPVQDDQIIDVGYAVDIGIAEFASTTFDSSVWGFVQADVNNDGNLDFINGIEFQDNFFETRNPFIQVTVNLGDGDGGFGDAIVIFERNDQNSSNFIDYRSLDIADLNNDGNVDIVFTDRAREGRLFSFLGDGQGGFAEANIQSFVDENDEAINISDFIVADINGDGNEDLIGRTGDVGFGGVFFEGFWVAGNGDGTFADTLSVIEVSSLFTTTSAIGEPYDVADLDGDGDLDFVFSLVNGDLPILHNDGDGNFSIVNTVTGPAGSRGLSWLQIADLTGDGNLDIGYAFANGTSSLSVAEGDGSGVEFTPRVASGNVPAVGNASGTSRPTDIDGDGDLDLLLGTEPFFGLRVRPFVAINDGSGNFTETYYPTEHFGGLDIAAFVNLGDYNNDGVLDLSYAVTDILRGGVGIRLGTRTGEFGATRAFSTPETAFRSGLAVGDFDGDDNPDIVDITARVTRLGNGDGSFSDPVPAHNQVNINAYSAVADFNSDGLDDFVSETTNDIFVGLSNGNGTFATPFVQDSSHFFGYTQYEVADFNQDGHIDIIARADVERIIDVWINDPENPGESFTKEFSLALLPGSQGINVANWAQSIAVNDFTGDGIVDFATPNRDTEGNTNIRLQIWEGDGTGQFAIHSDANLYDDSNISTQFGVTNFFYNPGDLLSGDIDNDGDSDLVSSTTAGARIFLNDGTGNFEFSTLLESLPTSGRGRDTYLTDLDSDGNLDLVFLGGGGGGTARGPMTVHTGNGDGTFASAEQNSLFGSVNVVDRGYFTDFDGDGHVDFVHSSQNIGNFLAPATSIYFTQRDGAVDQLAFDLDGDGNEEILVVNEQYDRLQIYQGDNLGEFTRLPDLQTGRAPQSVAVGDLDGDGEVEIFVANRASASITVYTGNLESGYSATDVAVGGALIDIESADVNGDGFDDVFALDVERGGILRFISDGTTTLVSPDEFNLGDTPEHLTLADANGDGSIDAVVTLPESNRLVILDQIASDLGADPVFLEFDSTPGEVAVLELNDDGNPDIAVTLPEQDAVSVHYGLGNSQFSTPQLIDVGDSPESITVADADEDGRLDLVVANVGDATASVIYNRFDPNEVYNYDADAIDPDNDTVSYRIVDGPGGLFINSQTGEVIWAASANQVGVHTVTIEASDGRGGIATQTYQIEVEPARENSTPLIATEPVARIGAGETFEYQTTAVDADNDALRYRILSGPEGATIDPVTGLLQWDGRTDGGLFTDPLGNNGTSGPAVVPVGENGSLALDTLTVEGWFNQQTLTASNGAATLFQYEGATDPFILRLAGNNRLQLFLRDENNSSVSFTTPFEVEANRWFHVAFTVDDASQTFNVYIDGESVLSDDLPASFIYDATTELQISGLGLEFSGLTDNFRVWNEARTVEQIREGLGRQFDGDPALVLDLRFEDDGERIVVDRTENRNDAFLTINGVVAEIGEGLAEAGIHSFVIGVEDGRGGMSTQAFDLEIVPELRGSISGTIFDDTNGDGIQNDGSDPANEAEVGLPDWLVFIDSNDNQFADPDEVQTITDADGNYTLAGLLPDTYPIRIAPAAGFESEALRNVEVSANEVAITDVAAVQSPLSQIQGQLRTIDGQAIGLWTAFVDLDNDGVRDEGEQSAISDRLGNFAISGLAAGTYILRADLPAGWLPAEGFDGVEVTLAADAIAAGNDLIVEPANTSVTGGVHFVTTAPQTVEARDVFRYASVATNINGDPISYDLSLAPEGLTIDPQNGLVVWQPTIDQVGENQVILRATDASGSISLQSFTIEVAAPNTAPVITSTPPENGYTDAAFVYNVLAQDAELDSLSYAIAAGPATATIDATGKIEWQPDATGSFDFEVLVTDTDGNEVTQSFTVDVLANAPDATPFVISEARTEIGLGQDYLSQISGTDALGRDLIWSLVDGPADIEVSADGIISFTPVAIGLQTVVLTATNADGETEEVSFELNVVGRPVINTPVIVSQPIESATIGNEYQYDVTVTGVDGELLSFTILDGPVGASIDPNLGTLRWTPVSDQLGDSDFVIEVANADGLAITQEFTVTASRFGGPPRIVSTPPTEANVGGSYLYTVGAIDAEGDPLTYRLLDAPAGLTINETTGEISWTPTADQTGLQTTVIEVVDGFGGATTQAFAILVGDGIVNEAPSIESEAPRFTAVGSDYSYQVVATDPEGTDLTYEISRGPAGLTISDAGLVSFTPADGQAGQFVVTIRVTDAGGATSIESFELDVLAENRAPVITSVAPSALVQGVDLRYDVLVSDADLDPFAFELIEAPAGTTINAFGQIVLENTSDLPLGDYDFEVRVSDPRGGEATQSFTVELQADTEGPRVSLVENLGDGSRNIFPWQGPFVVFARAIDNVAVASLTLTANGQDIPLSADGSAAFTFEEWGFRRITATATAVDTSGNISTETISFDYDFPEGFTGAPGQTLPTAIITSPQDAGTAVGFVSITGTANHEEFDSYRLSYRLIDDPSFTEILRSETAVVNGELGVWDTSLLRNDEYVLRLEVANSDGVVNVAENNVGLAGDLKLGNFQLAFTDLVVPLAGIPIEITRVYDTLQADVEGELGFGWRLDFRDTNLQVGLPESGLEDIGIYSALRPGVKVYLNVPGEGRQGFTFNPDIRALGGLGGDNLVLARPRFTPDPGVTATLSTGISNFLQVNNQGELMAPGGIPYNPASPDFGGAYVVTTNDGITYRINGATGQLDTATDRSGNTLTFTDQGIESDAGIGIEFERDAAGRISRIIDPSGNSVQYGYTAGRLASFTDRNENVTQYVYDPSQNNFLSEVIDPLGRSGVRSEFDDEGRLTGLINNDGTRIELDVDLGNSVQILRDGLGRESQVVFDNSGNVVTEIDALGNVTQREYDANGNETATIDALGNQTSFEYNPAGLLTKQIDPNGIETEFTYDADGNLLALVNALGEVTSSTFDENGNVVTSVSLSGSTVEFLGDAGSPDSVLVDQQASVEFEYDSAGRVIRQTDSNGLTTTFEYDAIGNLLETIEIATIDGQVVENATSFTYDNESRVLTSTDSDGNVTQFVYDAFGNVVETIGANGAETLSEFNDSGLIERREFADGSTIELQYNAIGNLLARTDQLGRVTRFEYDQLDRLVATLLPDETPADDSDNPTQTFEYNAVGRVVAEINELGNRTEFEYDVQGNVLVERDALGRETRFEYDSLGRVTRVTNTLGQTTTNEYDSGGNLVRNIFNDGSSVSAEFDLQGNQILQTDQNGNQTSFEYDEFSRLVAVVDALGSETRYEYDGLGNLVATIDANGNTTRQAFDDLGRLITETLPEGQSDLREYDALGRIVAYTDFNGQTTEFTFDALGRVTETVFADGTSEQFGYDLAGNLVFATNSEGSVSYQYDARNRIVELGTANGQTIEYTYDVASRLSSVSSINGVTTYAYDEINQLTFVELGDGSSVEYEYSLVGDLLTTQYSNGITITNEVDELGRIAAIEHRDADGNLVQQFEYEFDATGRILSVAELDGRFTSYVYDAAYRLILEASVAPEGPQYTISHVYDAVGNRLQEVHSETGQRDFAYDGNNRLTDIVAPDGVSRYEYDDNGNLLSIVGPDGSRESLVYDAENQLVEHTTVRDGDTTEIEFAYDATGERVSRTVDGEETQFVVDPTFENSQVIAELDASGNLITGYGFGLQRITQTEGGVTVFLGSDLSSGTRVLYDNSGQIVDQFLYDAYGRELLGNTGTSFLYRGEQRDFATGLDFLRARYLSTNTGSFISRDPFQGFNDSPVTLNEYLYAAGDPINNSDPSGEVSLSETLVSFAVRNSVAIGVTTGIIAYRVGVEARAGHISAVRILEITAQEILIGGAFGLVARAANVLRTAFNPRLVNIFAQQARGLSGYSRALLAGFNSTRVAQALTAVGIVGNLSKAGRAGNAGRVLSGVVGGRAAVIQFASQEGGINFVRIVSGAGRGALPRVGQVINVGRTRGGEAVFAKITEVVTVPFSNRVAASIPQFAATVGQLIFAANRAETGPVDNIPVP